MIAYKVFDYKDCQPLFLFHGLKSSRRVPLDKWITAEKKEVTDGSNNTTYLSGFHAFPNAKEVADWAKWVKNLAGRVVVKVEIKKTRRKVHGRGNVILAEKLKVSLNNWNHRVVLPYFILNEV